MPNCTQTYLRKTKRCLRDCPGPVKRRLLQGLGDELAEYAAQHPACTLDDLIAAFRPPQEAAQELCDNVAPVEKLRVRRRRHIITALLAVVLACVIAGLGYWIWDLSRFQQVYGEDIIYVYPPYQIPDEIEGE